MSSAQSHDPRYFRSSQREPVVFPTSAGAGDTAFKIGGAGSGVEGLDRHLCKGPVASGTAQTLIVVGGPGAEVRCLAAGPMLCGTVSSIPAEECR